MNTLHQSSQKALDHIKYLSQTIGGRGSCTLQEKRAGDYVAAQLQSLGVEEVRFESFRSVPSTYWPFILVFSLALMGLLALSLAPGQLTLALAALLNLLGVWGMLAETNISGNWVRWILPKRNSQNVVGMIRAKKDIRQRVVLCAHLDTHRTPVFYSSKNWHRAFSLLVTAAFLSLVLGTITFGAGAITNLLWLGWVGLLIAPIQIFALVMVTSADFTPFSPGANDNASGVGVTLALVEQVAADRLQHTEIHLAFTGCEDVGAYGVQAYLDAHAEALGRDAVYIILDEVAIGRIKHLSSDGLILKHATHPRALELARSSSATFDPGGILEQGGLAYTDALAATQRGLIAITVSCDPGADEESVSHWHQMSDKIDTLKPESLQDAYTFVWRILQELDQVQQPA